MKKHDTPWNTRRASLTWRVLGGKFDLKEKILTHIFLIFFLTTVILMIFIFPLRCINK